MEAVDGILDDLKQSSALFLGNPTLFSQLTEWVEDGRMSRLILKRCNKSEAAQQAEICWIGSIGHDRFRLSVDGGWRIYGNDPRPSPFTKAKATCYTTAPKDEWFQVVYDVVLQNAKNLVSSKKRYNIKNSLFDDLGSSIKVRHACFEVQYCSQLFLN